MCFVLMCSVINGRAIRLSYSSARSWLHEDENPAVSPDASSRYNVIMEGHQLLQ